MRQRRASTAVHGQQEKEPNLRGWEPLRLRGTVTAAPPAHLNQHRALLWGHSPRPRSRAAIQNPSPSNTSSLV